VKKYVYEKSVYRVFLGLLLMLATAQATWSLTNVSLADVVKQTMAGYFAQTSNLIPTLNKRFPATAPFEKPTGVFVTLTKDGKTRACWGSVYPQQPNAVQGTIAATLGALTKDYRYPPITKTEWPQLKPQVTIVDGLQQVQNVNSINPLRDGLMVRAGNKSGVILPGEARSAHHQLVMARLKAGVSAKSPQQLYRLRVRLYD